MWLIMGVEIPAVTAVVARLPNPERGLAAFGAAFALALIVEGPVVQFLSAGTALGRGRASYKSLVGFTAVLSTCLVALHIAVVATPLFHFVAVHLIGLPADLLGPTRSAFLWFIPWTPAIAFRRVWQGILIRHGRTRAVPIIMVARISGTISVLAFVYVMRTIGRPLPIDGASAGAAALSFGVIVGAVSAFAFVRRLPGTMEHDSPIPTAGFIRFYWPLALTSLVALGARPVLTAVVARGAAAAAGLAAWPVIYAVMFMFQSIGLSYQEAVIALRERESLSPYLPRFSALLVPVLGVGFLLFALTPLGGFWFRTISGLPSELVRVTQPPVLLLTAAVALSSVLSFLRGLLVSMNRTGAVSAGTLVNLVVMSLVGFGFTAVAGASGVVVAAAAFSAAICAETTFLALERRVLTRARG